MSNEPSKRERLYRIWLSYRTTNDSAGREELRREVIATEALRALQTVLSQCEGADVLVATIEQVSDLAQALRDDIMKESNK